MNRTYRFKAVLAGLLMAALGVLSTDALAASPKPQQDSRAEARDLRKLIDARQKARLKICKKFPLACRIRIDP